MTISVLPLPVRSRRSRERLSREPRPRTVVPYLRVVPFPGRASVTALPSWTPPPTPDPDAA